LRPKAGLLVHTSARPMAMFGMRSQLTAEGFVDADALHIDREPLWGALQWRGGEAAITQI